VVVINPDMVHTGHSGDTSGWTYRMFYPSVHMIKQVADAISDKPGAMPFFKNAVIKDKDLAADFRRLHMLLEHSQCRLEREAGFYAVMGKFIIGYAGNAPKIRKVGSEKRAVKQAINLIKNNPADNISLESLSRQVGLSAFYFSRIFQQQTGLPPHAYRKQQRIQLAKRLLRRGLPIAQVAAETGFADQSHLTRHFKQIIGVTPGRYAFRN
jgi:AraC-like DNA-binding protein